MHLSTAQYLDSQWIIFSGGFVSISYGIIGYTACLLTALAIGIFTTRQADHCFWVLLQYRGRLFTKLQDLI
jgi:hypothetical protein